MCQKSHAKLAKRKACLSRNKTDANTMHTRTHTHTQIHAHTHTHTRIRACTHTHTIADAHTIALRCVFCAVNDVKQLQDTAVAPGHGLQKMTQRPLQLPQRSPATASPATAAVSPALSPAALLRIDRCSARSLRRSDRCVAMFANLWLFARRLLT